MEQMSLKCPLGSPSFEIIMEKLQIPKALVT